MIHGIGTDIVAVARLRRMWERHGERVLEKLLAPREIDEFAKAADKGRFLAKRFAAKEAFAKALGTGVRPPATLSADPTRLADFSTVAIAPAVRVRPAVEVRLIPVSAASSRATPAGMPDW